MTEDLTPEQKEAIKQYFTALAAGTCPTCQQPVQEQIQVGRCVYAEPCGHRQFQGTAKSNREKENPHS